MTPLGKCTTDSTGLIVTFAGGPAQFNPSWAGLQIAIGGALSSIASVTSPTQMKLASSVGQFSSPVPFAPNRETIYQAFFNLLAGIPGLVTSSRRPQIFGNVPAEQQPALFTEQRGENPIKLGNGIPYRWELDIMIMVYVYSADDQIAPVTLLNPIVDQIELLLPATSTQQFQRQTLNGLVYEVRLLGDGKADQGSLGNQALSLIPARITTT